MRSLITTPFQARGAIFAIVIIIAFALLSGLAGFRHEPGTAEATLASEVKKILASDAESGDLFGISLAISGDTAIVGAYYEDGELTKPGAAYVFRRDQGGTDNWGQVVKLTASDAEVNDNFGNAVAISGDIAVIGAWTERAGGTRAGAAYVFHRDEGGTDNWGEVKKLTASDAEELDEFGVSVGVSGDTIIVGAYGESSGGSNAGAAYVFRRDEGGTDNWGEVKKITASDAEANDRFGYVGISGDIVVVGAFGEDTLADAAGAAYIFGRDAGGTDNWGEVTKLTASDAEMSDFFGAAVAVSGDVAVIGAQFHGALDQGAAYVFERDAGGTDNWGEVAELNASDAEGLDIFGEVVAASGENIVVGARWEDAAGNNAGAAYVFRRNEGGTGNWGEVGKLTASDAESNDGFGVSVAVSSGTVAVGAWAEDEEGTNAGAAYLFEPPKLQEPGDTDGDGCSDQRENGPDATLGGQRDYKNPNDFYDVAGSPLPPQNGAPDGVIDLPNDILGVIQHHPSGTLGYDAQFDRGPWTGSNSWNKTQGPDGVIDLPNDILGVILQFSHSCQ